MAVLTLSVIAALLAANFCIFRDVRYPPFILCGLWLVGLSLYYLAPFELYPLSSSTLFVFATMLASFTAGGYLSVLHSSFAGKSMPERRYVAPGPSIHPKIKLAVFILSAAIFPLFLRQAFALVADSQSTVFFIALRWALQAEDSAGYGWVAYGGFLSFIATFLYAIEARNTRADRMAYYSSISLSFTYGVLSTGRTTILLILTVLLGIGVIQGRVRIRKLILVTSVFILSFGAMGALMLKGANPDASLAENAASVMTSMLQYATGPFPAFDHFLRENTPLAYGDNTFISFINAVHKFTGEPRISAIQQEVNVPFTTNVYTGIQPVYADFGSLGLVLAFGLLGSITTRFYIGALMGDNLNVFLYALSLFPLVFTPFSDQYFAPATTWLEYGVIALAYFRIRRSERVTLTCR